MLERRGRPRLLTQWGLPGDAAGREVSAFEVRGPKVDIDVSALPKGAYLVKLAIAKGIVSHRLLVE